MKKVEMLSKTIETFAKLAVNLEDSDLDREWQWGEYDEGLRFAFFRTYETLQKLAADPGLQDGSMITRAQVILSQYNAAFRDLQAILLPVDDQLAEKTFTEDEWPIRKVLIHMLEAEVAFLAINADALARRRAGETNPAELSDSAWKAFKENDPFFKIAEKGTSNELRRYHQQLHERVLETFVNTTDIELETPIWFWESSPMSLQFRLHRFDSHLRQHTVQIEKTLVKLDQIPNEAQRLVRLIYQAFANIESALMVLHEIDSSVLTDATEEIARYTRVIQNIQEYSE